MAGIAGIARSGMTAIVERMLDKIVHRGPSRRDVAEFDGGTLGIVCTDSSGGSADPRRDQAVADFDGTGHFAEAKMVGPKVLLKRDPLGAAPLYYGFAKDGVFCFASEMKALLEVTRNVHELPSGHSFDGENMQPYFQLGVKPELDAPPDQIETELLQRLTVSVGEFSCQDERVGSWLSGGLDSSSVAALAHEDVNKLHTFAAGFESASDLEYAREVADFIGSDHHEVVLSFDKLLEELPVVIYHLESFDALLVRSSITNYLVAKLASQYVSTVFSGEGADELFAGYEYLKAMKPSLLPNELVDITSRLHNTAFQRVDRCASAHGTVAHLPFAAPEIVEYALRIPAGLKIHEGVEKWILREAMRGRLPDRVIRRRKAKFWEGAGVGELVSQYADEQITDDQFKHERTLPNGSLLNSKEELMYYRIFKQHFGEFKDLSWMGRTKGAPRVNQT
jgi:asparagine synthase (glutamine-hydrolysing)